MSPHPTGLPPGDPSRTCGTCAWLQVEVGLAWCAAATEGEGPGVPVPPETPACALWEPPVTCGPCGACCREAFDAVPVTPEDRVRLGEDAHLAVDHDDGWCDLARVPSPLGQGTRCAALRGDGASTTPFRCAVYPRRPTNCRDLEPGSPGCLTARRRVGRSPWRPGQRPEGPLSRA